MENVVKNFLGYLKLNDEDEDFDDYMDEDEFEEEETRRPKAVKNRYGESREREEAKSERTESRFSRRMEEEPANYKEKSSRSARNSNDKVVPISNRISDLEVCIMKPSSFENSQDVCDTLLSGRACIVNLEGFDSENAQRIMDFISGCVYAINGKLHPISRYIFIFSPENVDITADDMDTLADLDLDFGVPTINKEF